MKIARQKYKLVFFLKIFLRDLAAIVLHINKEGNLRVNTLKEICIERKCIERKYSKRKHIKRKYITRRYIKGRYIKRRYTGRRYNEHTMRKQNSISSDEDKNQ